MTEICVRIVQKLSPWFEDRRHSTVEDIKRQLEYREKNKKAVNGFLYNNVRSIPEITMFLLMTIRGILLLHGSWMSMKIRI